MRFDTPLNSFNFQQTERTGKTEKFLQSGILNFYQKVRKFPVIENLDQKKITCKV